MKKRAVPRPPVTRGGGSLGAKGKHGKSGSAKNVTSDKNVKSGDRTRSGQKVELADCFGAVKFLGADQAPQSDFAQVDAVEQVRGLEEASTLFQEIRTRPEAARAEHLAEVTAASEVPHRLRTVGPLLHQLSGPVSPDHHLPVSGLLTRVGTDTCAEPETKCGRIESVAGPQSKRNPQSARGGAILWGGTVVFGSSTALLLAILSRHNTVSFAALSALLGLSFVISLIPSGVQLRSAALVADGSVVPRISIRLLAALGAVGFILSPVLGLVLRVSVAAVALIVLQLLIALPLAARRGGLIGVDRFAALGSNILVEGGFRVLLGAVGGLTIGITGLAAGLALATGCALIVLPALRPDTEAVKRPMTSLFNASITLVLLGFLVQMDVLMAPSGLSHVGATSYDLAAIPSKGVYVVLLAGGPIAFPFVRRSASRRLVIYAAGGTLALGSAASAVLLSFRRLIGVVLGQATPSLVLIAMLGGAMAAAGTTSVLVNAGVARGVKRPWPPLVFGMALITASWATHPSATAFALTVLIAQVMTMLLSAGRTLWGRRSSLPITETNDVSSPITQEPLETPAGQPTELAGPSSGPISDSKGATSPRNDSMLGSSD